MIPAVSALHPQLPPDGSSRWSPWTFVFLAVGLRLGLFGAWMLTHRGDWSHFVTISDAGSFLQVARCIVGLAPPESLTYYDTRIMAGWPLLIGPGLWILPAVVWLPLLTSLMTGISVWLFHKLADHDALTLLFVLTPPVWLLVGVQGMAEPAFFAAGMGAVLCLRKNSWGAAGLLGGIMCVLKPHGIFLAGGLALAALISNRHERLARLLRVAAGGVIAPVGLLAINFKMYGDPVKPFHTYGDDLVKLNIPAEAAARLGGAEGAWSPPLSALIRTPLALDVPLWKILYIHGHALLLIGLLVWAAIGWYAHRKQTAAPETTALRCWLLGTGAAILCAGPYWGFYSFDRYCIWLLPSAFLLLRDAMPIKRPIVLTVGLVSIAMAAGVLMLRH